MWLFVFDSVFVKKNVIKINYCFWVGIFKFENFDILMILILLNEIVILLGMGSKLLRFVLWLKLL